MDSNRIARVSALFAERRLTRRQTLHQGAAGLGVAALAATALGHGALVSAQDATPEASPVAAGGKTEFLFVQSFEAGSLSPKAGADGAYTLELKHGLGQTLFFSDRPERIVGAAPTPTFLKNLGFSPANPPNAALVADTGGGNEEIVVVELTNPGYDEASKTATYEAKILDDATRVEMTFTRQPATGEHAAASYGASHLFIDDCPDDTLYCVSNQQGTGRLLGTYGHCWDWSEFTCRLCETKAYYQALCNQQMPDLCSTTYPCEFTYVVAGSQLNSTDFAPS